MSGLLVRLVDRWPRWFSATRVPNTPATLSANGSHGLSRILDRSILPSTPLAAPAQSVRQTRPT